MSFIVNFPCFSIILSLLSAVISSALSGRNARRLSIALTGLVCALSAAVLYYDLTIAGEAVVYRMGHFDAPWGNELRFGIVEPLTMCFFSLSMLLCLVGGQTRLSLDIAEKKQNLFYVMADLVLASLLALTYTNDIFTGYVFIEICTLSSCGLLMIRQEGRTTIAATRYMIFSLLGSGLFLLGVVLMYDITGHLLMPNMKESVAIIYETGRYQVPLLITISLMTLGIAIKSGLFPFHYWMPETYGYATPAAGGILSGLISKGYIFLLIKIIYRVIGREIFYAVGAADILFILGCIAIIVGSLSAIAENDINRMIAFSSAAQIGYVYLGIGIATEGGMDAELFHIYFHVITKPALFLAAAGLSAVSNDSPVFHDLQGSAHRNKLAGVVFTVGALSMVGIPTLMGFISKAMFTLASFEAGAKTFIILIILAVSTVLNAVYFLRTVVRIYTPAPAIRPMKLGIREQPAFAVAGILFTLINFTVGLHPQPIIDMIVAGLRRFG